MNCHVAWLGDIVAANKTELVILMKEKQIFLFRDNIINNN